MEFFSSKAFDDAHRPVSFSPASLLLKTDITDSRKSRRCCLSRDSYVSHQLGALPSFSATRSPFVYSYFFTGLESVRLGLGSVSCVAYVGTASNDDEKDNLGKEPCPAASLLLTGGSLASTLA